MKKPDLLCLGVCDKQRKVGKHSLYTVSLLNCVALLSLTTLATKLSTEETLYTFFVKL